MFKNYLKEATNIHMTHIVDLVFNEGVTGTRKAINFMRDIRDMLSQGSGSKNTVITVKVDGSPAVLMGINPENGKFFVSTKSIFNVTPVVYYSESDIDKNTSGDLATKLKISLLECSKLGIKKGIYQGDILFTKSDIKKQKIDNETYYTFHPNTILYAIPVNSHLGKQVAAANIGIAWHTTYSGNSLSNLSASFGKSITHLFKPSRSSFMIDASYQDVTGAATFTDSEKKNFDSMLSEIGRKFQKMKAPVLNGISKDSELLKLVHIFNNLQIRENKTITDADKHTSDLYDFIHDRFQKEIDARKTDKSKESMKNKSDKILSFFTTYNRSDIAAIFDLAISMDEAKNILVQKLNRASHLKTFLKTKNGLRPTGAEGFVAIRGETAVKLVDRLEFSRANFSPDVLKGYQR